MKRKPRPKRKHAGSTYLKKNKSENKDRGSDDLKAPKDKEARTVSNSAVNSYTVNERAAIEDIEPEVMLEDAPEAEAPEVKAPEVKAPEVKAKVEIDPSGDVIDEDDMAQMEEAQDASDRHDKMMAEGKGEKSLTHKFTSDMTNMANDSTPLLSTVMREAAEIKKPELRDQAYFEITEYALSEGRFDSARMAHDMIEQDELSYTAKSRIAVACELNISHAKGLSWLIHLSTLLLLALDRAVMSPLFARRSSG